MAFYDRQCYFEIATGDKRPRNDTGDGGEFAEWSEYALIKSTSNLTIRTVSDENEIGLKMRYLF